MSDLWLRDIGALSSFHQWIGVVVIALACAVVASCVVGLVAGRPWR